MGECLQAPPFILDMDRKKKKCKECGKMDFIFSKGRCKFCAKKSYKGLQASPPKSKPNRRSLSSVGKSSLQQLLNKADIAFSEYIRLKYANNAGIVGCYTCSTKGFWKSDGITCGHYFPRTHKNTRYDIRNSRPQCVYCNNILKGNMEVYTEKLKQELGEEIFNELTIASRKVKKWSTTALKQLISDLNSKASEIKKEKNIT